ncbi:MAG: sarcosine oxidase subunit gamma family protein [Steroidobacteraceae bacterium]
MPDVATLSEYAAIGELTGLARMSLRGGPQVLAVAGDAFGVRLPTEACRAAEGDARAALWLGPDEQLLLVQQADWEGAYASLNARLRGMPHALVDISQRQLALQVNGTRAAEALASGCPLDLHPAAFPVGMCTRTLFFKAQIVLWRTAPNVFHIEVWRSFARYVELLLLEAAREFES